VGSPPNLDGLALWPNLDKTGVTNYNHHKVLVISQPCPNKAIMLVQGLGSLYFEKNCLN